MAQQGKMSIMCVDKVHVPVATRTRGQAASVCTAVSLCHLPAPRHPAPCHRHRKHSLVIMLAGSTHFELACVACAMAGRPLPRKLRRKARTAPSPTLLLASPTAAASRPRPQSAPTPPASAAVELSARQKSVIRAVLAGKSVFFTGPAGSGKSLLLRQLIRRLPPATTAVTASTGIAACNIGGVTLHSWAGMGRAYSSTPAADIARAIRRRRDVLGRWLATRVLVVDEVSMVEGPFLDKLEAVAREVRSSSAAFGGIQLVLVGDFYQLPPVASKAEQVPFAFQAAAWKRCIQHNIQLTDVFRQAHGEFVDILNEAREGSVSDSPAGLPPTHTPHCTHPLRHRFHPHLLTC